MVVLALLVPAHVRILLGSFGPRDRAAEVPGPDHPGESTASR